MLWKFRQRKKKKGPRRALFAGVALAVFTIFGFFILPPLVKSQLEKRASVALGRTVTVGKVRVNPYALSVTVEGFDVRLKDGTGSFLGWDRLYVNFDLLASLTKTWTLGAIELDGFHATAEIRADGTFNFADILEKLNAGSPAPAVPAKSSRPVRLGSFKVQGARLDFVDRQPRQPFATTLGPVSFALTEFVTTGTQGAPYHFEAVTEAGEKLAWSGTLAADPVASRGEFEIANLILKKYTPYLETRMQADVTEGNLSVKGRYEVSLDAKSRVMKLSAGEVHLRDLKVAERATGQVAVELPSLDVTGIQADAIRMKATVERVALAGGRIAARREKNGEINLLAMLQPSAPVAPAVANPVPSPTPEFLIGEVALQGFQVALTDLAAPRPAQLGLNGLQFSLKNVTLADGAVMPLQVAFDWAPQGSVKVAGNVSLRPALSAKLQTEVVALSVLPLSPYLEQFANARITQGEVSTSGEVAIALAGGVPAITFEGGVTLARLGLVDGAHNEELAGFEALALNGLKVATAPELAVTLAEVKLAAPYARAIVNADHSLNLAAVAKVQPAADIPVVGGALRPDDPGARAESGHKAPPTEAKGAAPTPKIEIGRVVITDGDFSLADRSVQPAVRMAVTRFGGTITGLSSAHLARADVDLQAAVDGAGPITIAGKLDPLGAAKFVDLKLDFKNVDLLPLSPYSGKYAGYELARGKLALDVKLQVAGRQLDSTNVVTLNQFTFGAPVASADATKLPVRLGVALLKDLNGQIVVDLPVSGNLDDPSFRVGRVVLRVIVNLLTKAAVSPFALLGSMFGGGGDELAYQEFAPGGSELLPAEKTKLDTMVKALINRPGLSVALEGGYDGPADTFALRQQKVAALVRNGIWAERRATDPNIPPPAQLEISAAAHAGMVKKLFDEKFPPGTQFGAPLASAPVATARPAAPKKGFLGRVVDVVTLKGLRSGEGKAAVPGALTAPASSADSQGTGLTLEEMTGRLAEAIDIPDDVLRALAAARAQRVRDYFINEGGIAADRLFLAQSNAPAKANQGPRVFLSLQ